MDMKTAKVNMIKQQINTLGNGDIRISDSMNQIPRELFTPAKMQSMAYADTEIPLAHGELMLKPRVIAQILQAVRIKQSDNILEIGTGSGYFTALLALISQSVNTVDIHEDFIQQAQNRLKQLNIHNVVYHTGDASLGWELEKQYDVIIINASLENIPSTIKSQLKPYGRLFCFLGNTNPCRGILLEKDSLDSFRESSQFETYIRPLKESSKANTFLF